MTGIVASRSRAFLVLAAAAAWHAGFLPAAAQAPRYHLVPPPGTTQVRALAQNWTEEEAAAFYDVPQGSKLLPLHWFLLLEQPDKEAPFLEAEHIRALGYLPRTPSRGNPHGLPVGFVRDGLHLGMTCAACHTNQIVHGQNAWIVDGAPTHGDFETLLRRLTAALQATVEQAGRFDRFAKKLLGADADDLKRAFLRSEMKKVLDFRRGYDERNLPRQGQARFGPGRVDAFGAIMNEVSSTFAGLPDNHHPADAPVSYPFLWDAPQHDFVQWNGAAENTTSFIGGILFGTRHVGALGRNAGEVMGVFGQVEPIKDVGLVPAAYRSSVHLTNLIDIEESLRKLWSPQWPAELPAIDEEKRAAGEKSFRRHCAECHHALDRKDRNRSVRAWRKRSVGTDPAMARNFLVRKGKTGTFEGQRVEVVGLSRFGSEASIAQMLKHAVARVLLGGGLNSQPPTVPFELAAPVEIEIGNRTLIGSFASLELEKGKFKAGLVPGGRSLNQFVLLDGKRAFTLDSTQLDQATFLGADGSKRTIALLSGKGLNTKEGGMLRLKEASSLKYIYKGRPLNGIWATAPYLHNGSVPNLDELLKKPEQRVKKFRVGSRAFDPVRVGFRTDAGPFEFDTTLEGNSNAGHDYGVEFTPEQRAELVEYMKSL